VGVGQRTIDQQNNNVGQAHRADQLLAHAGFPQSDPLTEIVVIQSRTLAVSSPAFRAVVGDVVHGVAPFENTFHNLRSPISHPDQVSRDGRTALVEWDMNGTLKAAERRVDPPLRRSRRSPAVTAGFMSGRPVRRARTRR
jgi:hypothetical protein